MNVGRGVQTFLILVAIPLTVPTVPSSEEETTSSEGATCQMKEIQFRLGTAVEFTKEAMESLKAIKFGDCSSQPDDCNALFNCGKKSSGVYTLWPKNRIMENGFQAYCDMETDGGGWTVIQRRGNFGRAQDYFFQGWDGYKEGFGVPSEDFWIGNDILFAISNQKKYSIRFDLKDFENNERWAKYDHFWIDSEENNYTLHVSSYKGNAGDSFSYHSGQPFSTKDRDNDAQDSNCAITCKGAWWYKNCYNTNLNALYLNGYHSDKRYQGINWIHWRGDNYSLALTEMKIKPFSSAQETSGEQRVIPT